MKKTILQINVVCGVGSTGRIAVQIAELIDKNKYNMYIAYGYGKSNEKNTIKIGTKLEYLIHNILSRLTGGQGRFSYWATKRFLKKVDKISPDIIHLHNIHGNYINYKLLFKYIKKNEIPVVWTLHDCWSYTGHCAYYSSKKCDKWKKKCYKCCNLNEYPQSLIDNTSKEYEMKKKTFTSLNGVTLVTPSNWLKEEVKKSFLGGFDIRVIHNGIDKSKFKFSNDIEVRKKYGVENKKIILGVASAWDNRKGLNYFIELSKLLKEEEIIILVGLSEEQIKKLPSNIIGIQRTENQEELVKIYSMSDVFFNPSVEETFSLVTVEAMACGVPCVVFNETAVPELINDKVGKIITNYDVKHIYQVIKGILDDGKQKYFDACIERSKRYDISNFRQYIDLYKELMKEKK